MNPPENGQYYTVKELADVTSGPVRSALLALETKVMMLQHDLAEAREAAIEECATALEADAVKTTLHWKNATACGCGAWREWQSITSARAVEIVRALKEQGK